MGCRAGVSDPTPSTGCGIIKIMSTVHSFQTDDARLGPVNDKVIAGERLNEMMPSPSTVPATFWP